MLGMNGPHATHRQNVLFFAAGIVRPLGEISLHGGVLTLKGVVLSTSPAIREGYLLALENLSDTWRCVPCGDAESAYQAAREADILILCPGRASEALLARLAARPMASPPYLLGDCLGHPLLDGRVSLRSVADLPAWLERREQAGLLPRLAVARLPEMTCLSRGLLRALSVPAGLGAWRFLPDMAALATLHPALMRDLRSRLYPLAARRHGMTPGAVERSLRLCVESAWSRGRLEALERFFGQSVDPERGKPTNREFLLRVTGQLTAAAQRLEGTSKFPEKHGKQLDIVDNGRYTFHNG